MPYSELMKNFEKIRANMRQFYVYGFKRREEYDAKSARSYDNERRRMESWLGDYMSFRQDETGKQVFLSVDSRTIRQNPLYKAFKAKSFTDNDLILHCYLLSMLADGEARSAHGIIEGVAELLGKFPKLKLLDDSTIRKKLREYESLGLITSEKQGRELFYRLPPASVDLASWKEAVEFFAEADPLGVIGSYLLDRSEEDRELFGFKHHYILHALDGEVLLAALEAIGSHRRIWLTNVSLRSGNPKKHCAYPLKIYVSAQSGREYLRIIYSPEYTKPEHMLRLKKRSLSRKRQLALREFALGVEGLERFARKDSLYRVHQCAFGVLAFECEPVDPRL